MLVVGLQGSPRRKGNSRFLLDTFLDAAGAHGAETAFVDVDRRDIVPCKEYTVCETRGTCPIEDDVLHEIYPLLRRADVIVAATPVFFYNMTAQLKALIDRCQLFWARKYRLRLRDPRHRTKKVFLLSMAATRGKNLFDAIHLTMDYFADALDADYAGHLTYRNIEGPKDMARHPDAVADVERAVAELMTPLADRQRVLFAGRHDAGRGPMAAALVRALGGDRLAAASGGVAPAAELHPAAIGALGEMGWDIAYEKPGALAERIEGFRPEVGIALEAGLDLPKLPTGSWLVWDLPSVPVDDPAGAQELAAAVAEKVKNLLTQV
ncbi:MAG: NAD(P)H-dependent oxidoreductase [Desulfobacterales bacterium]|nr:NAD(P)H-dependent oxidoreductase [Desulfobacterales bacterium]